jgi:hypothetical protein
MAELIVGRPREGRMGGQGGLYVRRPGEAQAWFGPANFEIPNNPAVWLVARIAHVNPKRVARITTTQPDGEKLVIFKETPGTAHFAFKDLPTGKTLKGEAVADDMNSILTAIDLTDVAPQSEVDFATKVWHAEIETFDGLTVKVDLVDRGGKPWARFGASAGKPMTDRDSQSDDIQKFVKTADEVAKEAEEINARVANWAYELQGPQASKLEANLAIFLEAEGPPSDSGPMGGFGPAGPGGLGGLPEGPPPNAGN